MPSTVSKGLVATHFCSTSAGVDWSSRYRPHLAATMAVSSAALFRVLEGEADWVLLHDVRAADTELLVANLKTAAMEFLAAEEIHSESYSEIFAAADARSIAQGARYVYMARTDFDKSRGDEKAFDAWYNLQHLPDCARAGMVRARRFKSHAASWQYAATYELRSRHTLDSSAVGRIRGFGPFTEQVRGNRRWILERVETYLAAPKIAF